MLDTEVWEPLLYPMWSKFWLTGFRGSESKGEPLPLRESFRQKQALWFLTTSFKKKVFKKPYQKISTNLTLCEEGLSYKLFRSFYKFLTCKKGLKGFLKPQKYILINLRKILHSLARYITRLPLATSFWLPSATFSVQSNTSQHL